MHLKKRVYFFRPNIYNFVYLVRVNKPIESPVMSL